MNRKKSGCNYGLSIRDYLIAGTFMIGEDGQKEPPSWKEYALKLEAEYNKLVKQKNELRNRIIKLTGKYEPPILPEHKTA